MGRQDVAEFRILLGPATFFWLKDQKNGVFYSFAFDHNI